LTSEQKAKIEVSAQSIDSSPHREVVKQISRTISRYDKVMGIRQKKIMAADLYGEYGVTFFNSNGSKAIYLDRKFFSQKRNEIEA
jgi:hypothetical protein